MFSSPFWQGTLLGVVVDVSGSMQTNLKNDQGGQYSRIESLSHSFQRAIDNIMKLFENTSADTPERLRLFIYGFGFCVPEQPLCDILAALKLLKKKINRYKALQSELKKMWLCEVERILEEGRVKKMQKNNYVYALSRNCVIRLSKLNKSVVLQHFNDGVSLSVLDWI